MTIAVVSEVPERGSRRIRIFTQNKEASGETLGAALDALQLTAEPWDSGDEPYLLLRRFQPDRFFPAPQRAQLQTLMAQWHAAQKSGKALPPTLQAELETLIQAEEEATLARSQALLDATRK